MVLVIGQKISKGKKKGKCAFYPVKFHAVLSSNYCDTTLYDEKKRDANCYGGWTDSETDGTI